MKGPITIARHMSNSTSWIIIARSRPHRLLVTLPVIMDKVRMMPIEGPTLTPVVIGNGSMTLFEGPAMIPVVIGDCTMTLINGIAMIPVVIRNFSVAVVKGFALIPVKIGLFITIFIISCSPMMADLFARLVVVASVRRRPRIVHRHLAATRM